MSDKMNTVDTKPREQQIEPGNLLTKQQESCSSPYEKKYFKGCCPEDDADDITICADADGEIIMLDTEQWGETTTAPPLTLQGEVFTKDGDSSQLAYTYQLTSSDTTLATLVVIFAENLGSLKDEPGVEVVPTGVWVGTSSGGTSDYLKGYSAAKPVA